MKFYDFLNKWSSGLNVYIKVCCIEKNVLFTNIYCFKHLSAKKNLQEKMKTQFMQNILILKVVYDCLCLCQTLSKLLERIILYTIKPLDTKNYTSLSIWIQIFPLNSSSITMDFKNNKFTFIAFLRISQGFNRVASRTYTKIINPKVLLTYLYNMIL